MADPRHLPTSIKVIERGWVSSNNIVFLGQAPAVVDTGYARHADTTVALVRHALGGQALARIVNTHAHSDHIGGNAALARAYPDVRITIPAGEAEVVRAWDQDALLLTALGQECERFAFDDTMHAGEELSLGGMRWQVIASPGHDMDSLMLWCAADGILISADALWGQGFGVLFPALPPSSDLAGAVAAQRATLAAIDDLAPRVVIPGHGAPFADVDAALARARAQLDRLEANPAGLLRHAAKVAVAYALMIEGRIERAALGARLAAMGLVVEVNRALFGLDDAALAELLAGELVKSGVARQEGDWLVHATR
ncbi:MAG: MBL fold metallo-hydrolase [Burkholderiales bacterium]|nr:MBL fold metallo-hydrolase [Burkholderiales bacterium]